MDRLKYVVLLVAVFSATISCSTAIRKDVNSDFHQSTLQSMQNIMDSYGLPSLSVAVSIYSKVIFSEAIGYADIGEKALANPQTRYSVGSIAKPMTGVALAKLIDLQKISLGAIVNDFIPLEILSQEITVKQLASHTAGIPHKTEERENYEFNEIFDHKSPFEVLDAFSNHSLLFDPGTDFKYSSNGYILLSALIEKVSGQNYVKYMENTVWKEFNMNNTELDTSSAGQGREATYYSGRESGGGYILATEERDRSFLFGGGGFISTPTDLVKFSQALYKEGYLSEGVSNAILSPAKLKSGVSNPQNYGIGWRIDEITDYLNSEDKLLVAHHGGVTGGAATAYLYVIPSRKAAISFATNTLPERFWEIRPAIEKILIDHLRQIGEG